MERMKLDISNLVCRFERKEYWHYMLKFCSMGVHLKSRDLLNVWEISANISETVQDKHSHNGRFNGKSHVSYRMAPISMT